MLAFNAVIFVIVIVVLIKHALKRSSDHNKISGSIQLMINIISVFVLFGLTWIFGALTILKADQVFQIVFTLINSFQGFLIFIFFCALNKEVRLSWLQLLRPRDKKHKWSLSSTRPSTKLSLMTRGTILGKPDTDETVFTEEIKALGPTAKLTRTLSLHKRHMEEVVTVTFDEGQSGEDVELNLSGR